MFLAYAHRKQRSFHPLASLIYSGTVERIATPGAVISGLISSFAVTGPRELKSAR